MDAKIEAALKAAGVAVHALFDGARLELPPRPARPGLGAGMAVGGLVLTAFMVLWISFPWAGAAGLQGSGRWVLIAFGLLGLPGLVVGLLVLIAGISLARGMTSSVVEVSRDRLAVTEQFGPFRWTWRRTLASVDRFVLGSPGGSAADAAGTAPPGLSSPLLQASGGGLRKPMLIAALYPPALLDPLARALSAVCGKPLETTPIMPAAGGALEVAGSRAGAAAPMAEPPQPPPGTMVRVLNTPDGMAVDVPPAGLIRGSKGLFIFAVVWVVFCGFIFVPLAIGLASGGRAPWPVFLMAGLFMAIGSLMLGISIHMGRRRSMIAVAGATIGIRQIGPFGRSERRFARADVADIQVGPSGLTVNNHPVMHLAWRLRDGRTIGCLSQLSEPELHWLAAELRRRVVGPAPPA